MVEKPIAISAVVPQLRTTDLESTIRFYTEKLGFEVEFRHRDFYAGIRAGGQVVHLKLVDETDPSIAYVDDAGHFHLYLRTEGVAGMAERLKARGVPLMNDVHETAWETREIALRDDQGHTIYVGEPL